MEFHKLSDIATIQSGVATAKSADTTPEYLLPAGAVNKNGMDWTQLSAVTVTVKDKRYIENDDILMSNRGRFSVGIVSNVPHANIAIPSFIFKIKPTTPSITAQYLYTYMNTPAFQNTLKRLEQGAAITFASISDIKEILIPVPPLAQQSHITQLYALHLQQQNHMQSLQHAQQEYINAIITTATSGA